MTLLYATSTHTVDYPAAVLSAAIATRRRFCTESCKTPPADRDHYERGELENHQVRYDLTSGMRETIAALQSLHARGFWVEVYDDSTRELLAGPFAPDQKLPPAVYLKLL